MLQELQKLACNEDKNVAIYSIAFSRYILQKSQIKKQVFQPRLVCLFSLYATTLLLINSRSSAFLEAFTIGL